MIFLGFLLIYYTKQPHLKILFQIKTTKLENTLTMIGQKPRQIDNFITQNAKRFKGWRDSYKEKYERNISCQLA